jgi:hypothetical protein
MLVWSDDGRRLFLVTPQNGGGEVRDPSRGLAVVGWWPMSTQGQFVSAARPSGEGRRLVVVDEHGYITVREMLAGQVRRKTAGEVELSEYPNEPLSHSAAVSVAGTKVALAASDGVRLVDVDTGTRRELAWRAGGPGGRLVPWSSRGTASSSSE